MRLFDVAAPFFDIDVGGGGPSFVPSQPSVVAKFPRCSGIGGEFPDYAAQYADLLEVSRPALHWIAK